MGVARMHERALVCLQNEGWQALCKHCKECNPYLAPSSTHCAWARAQRTVWSAECVRHMLGAAGT